MMDFMLCDGDLEIKNGDINLCHNDVDAIAQAIAIRLKTLAGEWFLDQNLGIPYLSQVLGKKRNDRLLAKLIANEIKAVAGVRELSDFSFDEGAQPRSIAIKFKATLTDSSTITINQSMGV